jgi:hypothetical protein
MSASLLLLFTVNIKTFTESESNLAGTQVYFRNFIAEIPQNYGHGQSHVKMFEFIADS